jgi:2'-5' RNA ligase
LTPGRVIGVAVAIPEPHGAYLQEVRDRLGDADASTVPTHVTLLPPTMVDGDLLGEIEQHLASVAAAFPTFTMRLRGTGSFRPVSPVVFVALSEGIADCERLENAVRSGVLWRSLHFNYHPHVTVAHGMSDDVLDAVAADLATYDVSFEITGFSLFEHVEEKWLTRQHYPLTGSR